jgi:hypothetical protein
VRHQASLLLGAFSRVQLDMILPFFKAKFDLVGKKEADNMAFIPYQAAMKYFDWSVSEEHGPITMDYLQQVRLKFPQVKNGTRELFPEICATLDKIYYETLTGTNYVNNPSITDPKEVAHIQKRNKEWLEYSSNSNLASAFWSTYKGTKPFKTTNT